MSEQAKIIAEIHEIVMNILKNSMASDEEGARIDALETLDLMKKTGA